MATPLSVYRPYDFDSIAAPVVVDSDTTPVVVQNHTFLNLSAGLYELRLSFVFSSPDTNDYVQFTYSSSTGDFADTTFRKEAQDADDQIPFSYMFAIDHAAAGDFNVTLSGILEANGQDATVHASNIIIEKKGE